MFVHITLNSKNCWNINIFSERAARAHIIIILLENCFRQFYKFPQLQIYVIIKRIYDKILNQFPHNNPYPALFNPKSSISTYTYIYI